MLSIPWFFAVLAHCAWAQQAFSTEKASTQWPVSLALDASPSYAEGSEEHRNYDRHQWITNLQKVGVLNRSLPTPYRVAIPLMSFGDANPRIMLTYAKNMPGNIGGRGLMLFITVEIP
ncbi:hypothetical protein [Herminiimonas sp. CN]|uniref:hypothetical protein n=1 Tax=Herminiimonas sp. CN TaxID=1349818 RepID=UPI0009DD6910|nr:hypothetical protein [Herminiimonas sp. CN]